MRVEKKGEEEGVGVGEREECTKHCKGNALQKGKGKGWGRGERRDDRIYRFVLQG